LKVKEKKEEEIIKAEEGKKNGKRTY